MKMKMPSLKQIESKNWIRLHDPVSEDNPQTFL